MHLFYVCEKSCLSPAIVGCVRQRPSRARAAEATGRGERDHVDLPRVGKPPGQRPPLQAAPRQQEEDHGDSREDAGQSIDHVQGTR